MLNWVGVLKRVHHISNLSSKRVLILGTGGAARALISGFLKNKALVSVVHRNPKSTRTRSVMKDFGKRIEFVNYQKPRLVKILSESDIICNTTSCGMSPKSNESPLLNNILKRAATSSNFSKKLFFDAIFNPYETQFLKEAKKLGADTQGGTETMIYQGVRAFELWTGKKVGKNSIEKAKKVLKTHLLKLR